MGNIIAVFKLMRIDIIIYAMEQRLKKEARKIEYGLRCKLQQQNGVIVKTHKK